VGPEAVDWWILPHHFSYFPFPFSMKVRRQSNGIGSELVLCIITERSLFDFLDNIIPSLGDCLSSLCTVLRHIGLLFLFFSSFFRPSGLLLYLLLPTLIPLSPLFLCFSCQQSHQVYILKHTGLSQQSFFFSSKTKKERWAGGWVLVRFCLFLSWLLDCFCGGLDGYFVGSLTIHFFFSKGVSQVSLSVARAWAAWRAGLGSDAKYSVVTIEELTRYYLSF